MRSLPEAQEHTKDKDTTHLKWKGMGVKTDTGRQSY